MRLLLISCEWFRRMYERDLPAPVPTAVWPAGVETELWRPPASPPPPAVLLYDKVRWRREEYERTLIGPIRDALADSAPEVHYLRYGDYEEEGVPRPAGAACGRWCFLCEHETQGFAYLQALACGVPILAWGSRGGSGRDPTMYPARVRFGPVTSVPYFSPDCGERFRRRGGSSRERVAGVLGDRRGREICPPALRHVKLRASGPGPCLCRCRRSGKVGVTAPLVHMRDVPAADAAEGAP